MRGEYREAREIAETLLREAGADARGPEAGTARRMLGLVRLYQGNLKEAQAILEREATEFQLGPAGHVTAAAFLALTEWHLGEVERARQNIERAIQRADETADAEASGPRSFSGPFSRAGVTTSRPRALIGRAADFSTRISARTRLSRR
jgi:tetratricopeptide (TPR) repeat protein